MMKKLSAHPLVAALSGLSAALVLGVWIWALAALAPVGAASTGIPLILHFDDLNDITNAGGFNFIIFVGLLAVLIILMNFFIALEFDERDAFFGKFIASMTLVFAVLLFIAFAAIINVNV